MAYFTFPVYTNLMVESKETVIREELKVFRQGIEMYRLKYGKYPESLMELDEKGIISFSGKSEEYLNITVKKKDSSGAFLDPFGNIYVYDKSNGLVKCGTKKYEKW
jgi:hypothetical protein